MATGKTDFHLGIADKILLLGATIGAVGSLYFLANDQFIYNMLTTKQERAARLGDLSSAKNDVRRKLNRSLLWFDVSSDVELYEGDSIFTGPDSSAVVQLDDDLKLELEPNSLVVVSKRGDELLLDLQVGQFVAQTRKASKKNIAILQGGQKTKLKIGPQGRVKIAKSKKGNLSLSSTKGQIEVDINGKKDSIQENQKIQIDEEMVIKKINLNVELLSPKDQKKILLKPDQKQVSLSWKSNVKNANFKVLVAKDRDFENVIFKTNTNGESVKFDKLLNAQSLFWKVQATAKTAIPSESVAETFLTVKNRAVKLFEPFNNAKLVFKSNKDTEVNLTWQDLKGVDYYEIQVARDAEFKDLVLSKQTALTNYVTYDIGAGSYFWRVRGGILTNQKMKSSKVSQFSVEVKKSISLPNVAMPSGSPDGLASMPETPSLENEMLKKVEDKMEKAVAEPLPPPILEENQAKTLLSFNPFADWNVSTIQRSVKNHPIFSWQPTSKEALFSKIQISRTKDFKEIDYEKSVDKTKFRWKSVQPGVFYWRVASMRNLQENHLEYSSPNKVQLLLPSPVVRTKVLRTIEFDTAEEMNRPKHKVKIEWDKVPLATHYKMKIDGKVVARTYSKTSTNKLIKSNGVREIQLAAASFSGELYSKYSKKMKLKVKKVLRLARPQLQFPENGVTIVRFGEEKDDLIFNWSEIENATSYKVQISTDKMFNKVIIDTLSDGNSYVVKQAIKAEMIYWRVKALRTGSQSKWSKFRRVEF